ncbi:LysR family transcriptional regulator [Silvibacterium dinghuense]|uniref:LysR family transcriptional regulator n=1 Tax=Silvibacterium dinghuense TaxID=1560006 RepID=A0A4Q1SGZ9_9BACT|nr:LysR family transcriptional regulator [Silvibacterium dinghuense]RXS96831.1 LysR family transcriptional regulator [Silvibacterium dinghuense]GGG94015.1 LysR family transcriptional regulator [Silvibacterium dinghuense]
MDRFAAMEIFVRVVDSGSFSSVARERGIGQPAVSKQISALETELGTELLHRNTRSIALTEAGREFYQTAQRILDEFESTTSRIGRGQTAPHGLIRVSVQASFARLHLLTKLAAFFERYPEIVLEFGCSDGLSTLIEDGFDLAVHSGHLPDSDLVARRFAQTRIVLVATPQFVMRHRLPKTMEDLRSLPAIPRVEGGAIQPWEFGTDATQQRFLPSGVFRTADFEQLRMGVLEHLGIAQAPAWLFAAELREGTVLRLLSSYERTVPISALRPAGRRAPARVRALMDYLEETFALCTQFNPSPAELIAAS